MLLLLVRVQAGAKVAYEIAKSGFDVLILEKAQSPGKSKVCGGALSPNSVSAVKFAQVGY